VRGPIFTTFFSPTKSSRAGQDAVGAAPAMQERRVTIDRETHALSPNFTVFATQNPLDLKARIRCPKRKKIASC